MEPIVEASGLVILTRSEPQQLLLLQHPDRWDFPKGHLEDGETHVEAALRETLEETGIAKECIQIDPDFQFSIEYPVRSSKRGKYWKRVTYFLGYIDAPMPVQLTEHIGYTWLDWPVSGPLQANTVDPLLNHLRSHVSSQTSANRST